MNKSIPAIIVLLILNLCHARTITVDDDGPADFNNIQAAIDSAIGGDTVVVADGIYTGQGNRGLDFNGKAITVKSENGPANCVIDCQREDRGFYFHQAENYASVVDGFTITRGFESYGAGIYCRYDCAPTIVNCVIEGNEAQYGGGGIDCRYDAGAAIANCFIRHNSTGGDGAGICCNDASLTLTDCTINDNSADDSGGGIYCSSSSLTVTNCKVGCNSTGYAGGAMYCYHSSPTVINCTFSKNTAHGYGGAIYCYYDSLPTITNCTFNGNAADERGGGIFCGYGTAITIINCIFANNQNAAICRDYSSSIEIGAKYCLFNGNTEGDYYDRLTDTTYVGAYQLNAISDAFEGNVDGNPNFAFADDPHIMAGSACIDRGTNEPPGGLPDTDMDGNPRILDGDGDSLAVVDIGALEYNSELPSIAVSPSALEFIRERGGPNPDSQYLQIRNCGGSVLNWHIDCDCPWLEVSPADGTSSGQIDQILIAVDTDGLPQGIHRTVLSVTDPNAANSPCHISVTLRIKGTLHVPEQYPTIQEAIDAAMEGELIEVAEGMYNEAIRLDKKLDLIGVGQPVIDADGTGQRAVTISADGCIINGFKIAGGTIGIDVQSSDNTISNNIISTNDQGIALSGSADNVVENNEIIDNISRGLHIFFSTQNILKNNAIAGSQVNFQIDGDSLEHYNQDIDVSNTVDGKPIYYLVGKYDVSVDQASNAGCVVAVNCNEVTVTGLTLSNNARAVSFIDTTQSIIEQVVVTNCSQEGILLRNSTNNTLLENTISDSYHGIRLSSSGNNRLRNNILTNNVYNFTCEGFTLDDYYQNVAKSNIVDGRPIYYIVDEVGTVIDASSNAGCVFVVDSADVVVRDLVLRNNGTGVAFVQARRSTIENVIATSNDEAGILLLRSEDITLSKSNLSGNTQGLYIWLSEDIRVEKNRISRNKLGVYCQSTNLQIENCVVNNNRGHDGGGFIFTGDINATIINCTVCGNSDPFYQQYMPDVGTGMLFSGSGSALVSNCIVWANRPSQISIHPSVFVTYSDVQGGYEGQGNIDAPPMLTADGHLRIGSPCIDAGDPQTPVGRFDTDIDGDNRISGSAVDMGCDEYADIDADGLPNWWESSYFASYDAAQPDNDPDEDEHTNLSEYQWYSSDPTVPCTVYYVDANQPDDSNDGQSWQTAKRTIQAAIQDAQNSDKVLIAQGLYNENVDTLGKQILVQSTNPADVATVGSTLIAGTLSLTSGELQGCIISGLTISNPGGPGILCTGTSPMIHRCVISDNRSYTWEQGGGISCFSASPTITHCTISRNSAVDTGHGIYCDSAAVTIANSVISGNGQQDGIYLRNSNLIVRNCTIIGHGSPQQYYSYGPAVDCEQSELLVTNSILWNDTDSQIESRDSSVTVTYSNIKGGVEGITGTWQGRGNMNVDPCFVDPGRWPHDWRYGYGSWLDGDYHLKSQGWRWTQYKTHGANWVWDERTSLCIDAGNPASPLADELLVVPVDPDSEWGTNLRINMGAYGGTPQASMPPYDWAICGDLTNDGKVDLLDFAQWADDLQSSRDESPADLDRNRIVTLADFALLAEDWLAQTSWCKK